MAKVFSFLGVIAVVAVIAFSMTSCGGGGDDESDLGQTLNLSGQVYTVNHNDYEDNQPKRTPYTGSMSLSNNGGVGSVTNGALAFTIGKPRWLNSPDDAFMWRFYDYYDNVKVSDADARGSDIWLGSDEGRYNIWKGKWLGNGVDGGTYEEVYYIYVDTTVTITGTGKSGSWNNGRDPWTSSNLNITLKPGWNALTWKENNWDDERPSTVSYSVGEPSGLIWIYEKWN